jgi:hypothetical protein
MLHETTLISKMDEATIAPNMDEATLASRMDEASLDPNRDQATLASKTDKTAIASKLADTTTSGPDKREITIHYLRPGFEILQPDQVEKRKEQLGTGYDGTICPFAFKLSPTLAVKYGVKVKFREAQNMLFIEQHTTIPVPKVYAVYSCQALNKFGDPVKPASKQEGDPICTYIFMDLVAGTAIDEIWETWDDATHLNVRNELKDYVRQLREIPAENYVGGLNRGPVVDGLLRYYTTDLGTMAGSKASVRLTFWLMFHLHRSLRERRRFPPGDPQRLRQEIPFRQCHELPLGYHPRRPQA